MTEHLVFTLASAFASMGDLAGHERRGTLTWPGRSAVLGLAAAALGIRRDDSAALAALDPLRVAVAVFDSGNSLRDYHTVETVPTAATRRPDSRPAALRASKRRTNTIITLRDYRTNVLFGVALWGAPLAKLAVALERPTFALYLGRKSCPLAAPLAPRLVKAEGPIEALRSVTLPPWRQSAVARLVASDDAPGLEAAAGRRVERRQDVALDRARWHFAARDVTMITTEIVSIGTEVAL